MDESRLTDVNDALRQQDIEGLTRELATLAPPVVVSIMERLDQSRRAIVYRVLSKDVALAVFESLDPTLQSDLVRGLLDDDVAAVFADLDPDDRVVLLDELPATVAQRLLQGLPEDERNLTAIVLGYPPKSIGRRMSPELVSTRPDLTLAQTLDLVHRRLDIEESVYTLPVVDDERRLLGVIGLHTVMAHHPDTEVERLMSSAHSASARDDAEEVARRCAGLKVLAMPIVDDEGRLVGLLTVDDALRVLEDADSEDIARVGGSEPLRRPYLSTPVTALVRSRVLWLLVLAIGATLTVQVLEVFEATLAQMVVLSVFIPLLIGTGGNTGNQAATTVTRAIALGDVRTRDVLTVMLRELRVGLLLGASLGAAGFVVTTAIYGVQIGTVIGLTLLCVCALSATVGGAMPLAAKSLRADPAVFSNPFISTFVDATGLVVYFLIARAVLGI